MLFLAIDVDCDKGNEFDYGVEGDKIGPGQIT